MGGAVSSGRDNDELVDNLMSGNYIRTRAVERVFRALDRADYMSAEARDQAYKDLAWRNGPLHLSAPCIYSEVMEALELKPGLSFLNVGSGTGYLSTLVGLIIGSSGISHGVEALPVVCDYANKKLGQFMENSITVDEFDFCIPKYYTGNGLCLAPTHAYDRVYCGAGVLSKYENYFKQFTKVGGVLVMPLADTLVQMRRVSDTHWTKRNLLNVSFALLREPSKDELDDLLKLDEQCPSPLQVLSRAAIRSAMRAGLMRRHPELREPPAPPPRAPVTGPRRICIPYDDVGSDEELQELHELDEAGGAHEMNALLSLVLSMGQNRAAGSLRLDPVEDAPADDLQDVDALLALDRRANGSPPLLPDDGIIVLDVGGAAVRARRWHPRARSQSPPSPSEPPAPPASVSDSEALAARPDAGPDAPPGPSARPDASPRRPNRPNRPNPRADPDLKNDYPKGSLVRTPRTRTLTRVSGPAPRTAVRPPIPRPPWTDSSSDDEAITQMKERKRQKLDSGIGEGTASSGASPDKSDGGSSAAGSSRTDDDAERDTDMPWGEDDDAESGSGTTGSGDTGDGSGSDDSDDGGGDVEMGDGDAPRVQPRGMGPRARPARSRAERVAHRAELRRTLVEAARLRRRARARARSPGSDSGAARWPERASSPGSDSGAECAAPWPARNPRRVRLSLAMKRGIKELPLPHALKLYVNYGRAYQL